MKISDLPAERLAYLNEIRAIGKDDEGDEVLVGLTVKETSFYINYIEKRLLDEDDPNDAGTYLKLHEKHEKARLSVLGAEIVLHNEKPSIH